MTPGDVNQPSRDGNPWIVGRVAGGTPRVRLFCLPQAGGGAGSFHGWRAAVPDGVELATVELPGRGARSAEPPPDRLEDLADLLLDGIASELTVPWAVFGHSFGGLLAYETAVRAVRRGLPAPRALLVSGCRPPHEAVTGPLVSDQDDARMLEWLTGIGGVPPELMRRPAYLAYALRTVRADLRLAERYATQPPPQTVDFALHAFCGDADPLAGPDRTAGWQVCAGGEFTLTVLPGGHAFPFTGTPAMLTALAGALRPVTGERRGTGAGPARGVGEPSENQGDELSWTT